MCVKALASFHHLSKPGVSDSDGTRKIDRSFAGRAKSYDMQSAVKLRCLGLIGKLLGPTANPTICFGGPRGVDFSSHSENRGNHPEQNHRVAIQPRFNLYGWSTENSRHGRTIQDLFGPTPSPVPSCARTSALRYPWISSARRYVYHSAPRTGIQTFINV